MYAVIRTVLLSAVVALPLMAVTPAPAQAQDYWDGYWNWYDNTYRPYYYRQYGPGYGYYQPYNGYYGGNYYSPYGYGGYYGTPYRNYYGTGGVGYGQMRGGGSAVNVGPLTFGWR